MAWDTSLWDYPLGGFRKFIGTLSNESQLIPDALWNFRELPCFPHKFKQLTVGEVKKDPNLITELYTSRKGMQSEKEFKLGCKRKVRELQLIDSLGTVYKIDKERAKAKVVLGRHEDEDQTYCYALEVVIAPLPSLEGRKWAGHVSIIDSVNDLVSANRNGSYFDSTNHSTYNWIGEKGKQKGVILYASTLKEVLTKCGFNNDTNLSKVKKPCVLYINLKCRVIDWLGAKGKTHFTLDPFAKDIADTVTTLAYKMPSYHGEKLWSSDIYTEDEEESDGRYIGYLRDFLRKRRDEVESDPSVRIRDRLTQSGVWYRIRPVMIDDGFKPRNKSKDRNGRTVYDWGTTRRGLTRRINKTIAELWPDEGITREYLGIIANARAMMYFNGQIFPVDFDSKESLAMLNTTDLIIIEKAGITDVLLEAARKYQIAMVSTGGYFSDYVGDLMSSAHAAGMNVCVLTDYDIDGLKIHRSTEKKLGIKITRLGINRDVVQWMRENGYRTLKGEILEERDVEEEYDPNPILFKSGDDPYLRTKRIELDSIVQEVGADALWAYIIYQLNNMFPEDRDYRNVIEKPDPANFYTDEIQDLIDYIHDYFRAVYNPKWKEIKESAREVKGLAQVNYEEAVNDVLIKDVVHADEGTKKISELFKKLLESGDLPKIPKIEPEPEEPKKQPKEAEVISGEGSQLPGGVSIHVDPEYDIFGVYNPSSSIFKESKDRFLDSIPEDETEQTKKYLLKKRQLKDELTRCKDCNSVIRIVGDARIAVDPDSSQEGNYRCHDCQHLVKPQKEDFSNGTSQNHHARL